MRQRPCPACGHAKHETLFSVSARQFCSINPTYRSTFAEILEILPETTFPIVSCTACGFVFAGHLPSREFLDRVYDEVIDAERGFVESSKPTWVAHQLDLGRLLLTELDARLGTAQVLRVLDFGCGYGSLVRALNGPRVTCLGFETSPRRLAYLHEEGLPATASTEDLRARPPFHAVVLSDVLEHVPEPRETLAGCRALLVPQGLLLVNVPMFSASRLEGLQSAVARNDLRDSELNPWEHLNYFSGPSLCAMLRASGFLVLETNEHVDVGLRSGLRGVRRWGNGAKSAVRLVRSLFGWRPERAGYLAQSSSVSEGGSVAEPLPGACSS